MTPSEQARLVITAIVAAIFLGAGSILMRITPLVGVVLLTFGLSAVPLVWAGSRRDAPRPTYRHARRRDA